MPDMLNSFVSRRECVDTVSHVKLELWVFTSVPCFCLCTRLRRCSDCREGQDDEYARAHAHANAYDAAETDAAM